MAKQLELSNLVVDETDVNVQQKFNTNVVIENDDTNGKEMVFDAQRIDAN